MNIWSHFSSHISWLSIFLPAFSRVYKIGVSSTVARLWLAIFIIPGLVLSYICLQKMTDWKVSLLAITLLSLNSLFLLHSRRAMAEGIQFFLNICVVYLLIQKPNKVFLIGITAGLAFQAKQSSLPLLFVPVILWGFQIF